MLSMVKDYLKITWDHEDQSIVDMITRGQKRLESLTGTTLDYSDETIQDLLLDYCRYSYNNALEYFEENFKGDILRLQLQEAVKANAEQTV